jgi:hypothetical protein
MEAMEFAYHFAMSSWVTTGWVAPTDEQKEMAPAFTADEWLEWNGFTQEFIVQAKNQLFKKAHPFDINGQPKTHEGELTRRVNTLEELVNAHKGAPRDEHGQYITSNHQAFLGDGKRLLTIVDLENIEKRLTALENAAQGHTSYKHGHGHTLYKHL